jgi:hypothetical protein
MSDFLYRQPNDAMVAQEIARVKKLQKEQDAAVANLFRNKLPAAPKSVADPVDTPEPMQTSTERTADTELSSFGIFSIITFFLSLIQRILSSIGIRISDSSASQRASM